MLTVTVETSPQPLLSDFQAAFESISRALTVATEECSFAPAVTQAEVLGLKEQGDWRPSATYVYERKEGNLCLWLQTHWYDQSRPFSIQPDMNKIRLELRQGSGVLRSAEASFED